jgi:uncharacterized protein
MAGRHFACTFPSAAKQDPSVDHHRARRKATDPGSGLGQPMLWTVNYGKGRVFVTALGHDAEAMKSAGFVATLTRGTKWAATGDVSIPLPDELR